MFSGLSREDAAEVVGVSLRTIGHWETGWARPSYAALRLLRVLYQGEPVDPAWAGFRFVRGGLVSPEGFRYEPGQLTWWGLTCRRAAMMGVLAAENRQLKASREAASLGLVPSTTSGHGTAKPAFHKAFDPIAPHLVQVGSPSVTAPDPDPGPRSGLRPIRDPAGVFGVQAVGGGAP